MKLDSNYYDEAEELRLASPFYFCDAATKINLLIEVSLRSFSELTERTKLQEVIDLCLSDIADYISLEIIHVYLTIVAMNLGI